MKFLAAYIMRGRLQAMLVASTLALLSLLFPPVSIVSSAAVSLVTLRKGATEGLAVLLISSIAATVLGVFVIGNYQFALTYALLFWLPIWLISIVLREGRSLSLALEITLWLSMLAVMAVYVWLPDPAAVWQSKLESMIPQIQTLLAGANVDELKRSIAQGSHFMTGAMAASSMWGLMLGILLARWWQAVLYYPGGFRQEFLALAGRRPIFWIGLALVAIASMASGIWSEAASNILLALLVYYAFIGISVTHALLSRVKSGGTLLPVFYLLLLFMSQILLPPVVLVGLSDTWLDLRKQRTN